MVEKVVADLKNQDSKHVQENLLDSLSRMNQVPTADPPEIVLKNHPDQKIPDQADFKKKKDSVMTLVVLRDQIQENVLSEMEKRKMEKAENRLKETENGRIIPIKPDRHAVRSVRSGRAKEERTEFHAPREIVLNVAMM